MSWPEAITISVFFIMFFGMWIAFAYYDSKD